MSDGNAAKTPADAESTSDAPTPGAGAVFVRTLLSPSWPGLLLTLIVAAAWLGGLMLWLTPDRVASIDEGYFIIGERDDYYVVTRRVFQIQRAPEEPNGVIVLGSSTIKAAVTNEQDLTRRLSTRLGIDAPVHVLTTGGQTIYDMTAIVDGTIDKIGGAVLINAWAVHIAPPDDLAADIAANPRLGFQSDALDAELKHSGIEPRTRTDVYWLDNQGFYSRRMFEAAMRTFEGPRVRRAHPPRPRLNPQRLEASVTERAGWVADSLDRIESGKEDFDELTDLVDLIHRRSKAKVVLLDAVMSPLLRSRIDADRWAKHVERMKAYAAAHDTVYWDVSGDLGLTDDMFHDDVHINNDTAREAFSEELMRRLADYMQTRKSKPAGGGA
ncbi:MAG: hypothetical protein GC159_00140 [Phycisphaera sp.]|nr:hypothetical protein [Phycisphaera sp.]